MWSRNAWQMFAPIWFDEITVLGPRCTSADCAGPARHRICWPGGDPWLPFCARCAAGWRNIATAMGFVLVEQQLEYAPVELDNLQQRVRLLEVGP